MNYKNCCANNKGNETAMKNFSKFADIRHMEKDGRLLIVDDKNMTFMLLDDAKVHSSYDSGVWINSPFFTESIRNMFDIMWQNLKKP